MDRTWLTPIVLAASLLLGGMAAADAAEQVDSAEDAARGPRANPKSTLVIKTPLAAARRSPSR